MFHKLQRAYMCFLPLSSENATIPMTEGKLRECEEMLHRMKKIWPQYELDGDRNVWIVKPGDKSKGIGKGETLLNVFVTFKGSCKT